MESLEDNRKYLVKMVDPKHPEYGTNVTDMKTGAVFFRTQQGGWFWTNSEFTEDVDLGQEGPDEPEIVRQLSNIVGNLSVKPGR